jgi:hypothetical protein
MLALKATKMPTFIKLKKMLFLISSHEQNILFVVKTIVPNGLALEFCCSQVAPK